MFTTSAIWSPLDGVPPGVCCCCCAEGGGGGRHTLCQVVEESWVDLEVECSWSVIAVFVVNAIVTIDALNLSVRCWLSQPAMQGFDCLNRCLLFLFLL